MATVFRKHWHQHPSVSGSLNGGDKRGLQMAGNAPGQNFDGLCLVYRSRKGIGYRFNKSGFTGDVRVRHDPVNILPESLARVVSEPNLRNGIRDGNPRQRNDLRVLQQLESFTDRLTLIRPLYIIRKQGLS